MSLKVSGPYTEKKTIGDLIRHEYNPLAGYERKQATVYNRSGASVTISDIIGYPVKTDGTVATAFQLAVYGDEANVKGLIISPSQGGQVTLANNESATMVIIVRGPAIIDFSQVPTLDLAGATFVSATLKATLQALNPPILCNSEQPVSAVQTT